MPLSLVRRVIVAAAPFLFAVGGVLYLATDMAAPAGAYTRPLLVALALAAVVFAALWLITRSVDWGSVLSSAFMLFTFRLVVPALILVAIAVWWVAVRRLRRAGGRPDPDQSIPRQLASLTALAGLGLVALTGWGTVLALTGPAPPFRIPEYNASGRGGPNIYVMLLDGYPRADTLRDTFGIDNEGFLTGLEDLGFVVSSEARSNYPKTWTTLASAFNGAYVDRILPEGPAPGSATEQVRSLSRLINEASVLDVLRQRGYAIRTLPSLWVTTALRSADDYIDPGHLTEIEIKLITRSPWTMLARDQVADFMLDDHRTAVLDSIESTVTLAESHGNDPQFVLSHIPSPHTPFVLGQADPGEFEAPSCFPMDCRPWHPTAEDLRMEFPDFRDGLMGQVRGLNRLLLDAVRRMLAADPDAIIVLMSDHGIRYSQDEVSEHYRTLLVARAPGGTALFANDESPVNVFRKIVTYVGADLDPLPYERWGGIWDTYLDLRLLERERCSTPLCNADH